MRLGLGIGVIRAAAAVPQNAWQNIFTIVGQVLVVMILGTRTVIQAAGADTMQMRMAATVGGNIVLDSGTLVSTGDAVGTLYTITGTPADPIQSGFLVPGGLRGALSTIYGLILPAGNLQYTCTAAAGTGTIQWTLWYFPVNAGAGVVAA